jgi:uncharacterized protein
VIWLLLALGLVAVAEGLVLALAPSRIEQVLAMLISMTRDQRRMAGLASIAVGLTLIALARWIAA